MATQGSVPSSLLVRSAEAWVVALASTSVFLVALELTIVAVALPTMVAELGVRDDPAVTWIFSAYNIVVACLLLVFGWLADRVGRRRVFVAGLVLFAVGSVVSGMAGNLSALVGGRIIQGLGGSMMLPASLALILAQVAPSRRERAIATWGAMAGLAAALGPVVGGVLIAGAGWRAVFLLNVPIVLIALVCTERHLRESSAADSSTVAPRDGLFTDAVLDILRTPLALARLPGFRWAGFATLPFVAGFTAWVVMAPTFFYEVWGFSAVLAGLAILPAPLTMALVARPAASLVVAIGHQGLVAFGSLLSVAGLLWWWALVQADSSYLGSFFPGALLFGAGVGMGFPMLAAAAVRDVPAEHYATGAAGVATVRQIAMGLGAALAIYVVGRKAGATTAEMLGNHIDLWLICAGLLALAAALIVGMPSREVVNGDDPNLAEKQPTARFDHGTQFGLLGFIDPLILLRLIKRLPTISPRRLGRLGGVLGAGLAMQPLVLAEKLLCAGKPADTRNCEPPVFIIGHWRSGTTHLHNLLGQDEQFGCVRMFESIAPSCSLVTKSWLPQVMSKVMPAKRPMDNMSWPMDAPQEDEIALAKLTPYSWYLQFLFPQNAISTFERFVLLEGAGAKAKAEVQRHLQHIFRTAQVHESFSGPVPKRLLLKNPVHTARIPLLLELYPDARFVYLHRSPLDVFVSAKNLHRKILELTSMQRYDDADIERNVLEIYPRLLDRYLQDRSLLRPNQLIEVGFSDLEENPLDVVERVYAQLEIPGFEQARPQISAYIDSQADYKKNKFSRLPAREEALVRKHWALGFTAGLYPNETCPISECNEGASVSKGERNPKSRSVA